MNKRYFFIIVFSFITFAATAFDFSENGLYYSIVQDGAKDKVMLTCKSYDRSKVEVRQGELIIPVTVKHGRKNYTVIGISGYALMSNTKETGYTSIVIPEGIEKISANAFSGYLGETVEIPATVTEISSSAFIGSNRLKTIKINTNNKHYFSENGVLFAISGNTHSTDKSILVAYPKNHPYNSYSTPAHTYTIGEKAFCGCKNLKSMTITKNITTIEKDAFADASIRSYEFESNKTKTNGWAFGITPTKETLNIILPKGSNMDFTLKLPNAKIKYSEEVEWERLLAKAQKGDKDAMRAVAANYLTKSDNNSQYEAFRWYQRAAEKGDVASLKTLARWYLRGYGNNIVLKNTPMSFDCMKKAAEQNDAEAQYELSEYYKNGIGTTRNEQLAFKMCKAAAEQHFIKAESNLGNYYLYGSGTTKNEEEAMRWFGIAASKGDEKAIRKYNELSAKGFHERVQVPAMLDIIDNSVRFEDANSNLIIDANETCYLKFKVINNGKGDGFNCTTNTKLSGQTADIQAQTINLKKISSGETRDVSIPIIAGLNTQDGKITLSCAVDEEAGFGTQPIELTINTRAYNAPLIKVVDYAASSETGSLTKGRPFNLQLLLQNTKSGLAENVEVNMIVPKGVFITSDNATSKIGNVNGGETNTINYQMIASNNYSDNNIPIQVILKERYGKFNENKTINISLNQHVATTSINLTPAVENINYEQNIKIASIGSDVDKNIPAADTYQPNTFAVIIANENYQTVAKVPYALNDGRVFAKYCETTLGIPTKNIHLQTDATLNTMRREINWISQVMDAYKGEAKVIIYYAGHGIPDEKTRSSYLLPVDGYGTDINTGYKLDDIYTKLASKPTQSVTIIIDACFSGTKREGDMLASARGIAIKSKPSEPQGKTVVFSAATGDETAYPNKEQQHGMFTYYLLKKLQETKGDVTYRELGQYITEHVSKQSIVENGKSQTPTINASLQAENWQEWKLK